MLYEVIKNKMFNAYNGDNHNLYLFQMKILYIQIEESICKG